MCIKIDLFSHSHDYNIPTMCLLQLVNAGEDVLLFYNDPASFETLVRLMRNYVPQSGDVSSALDYHIELVRLLAYCTEGKNVFTEIHCHALLPLDDIVKVVTHPDCIPEVCCLCHTYAVF